ncbi:MAG: transporter substrate-binding domain-containing protein [gamma proteobacterium symbiont of Lucinoma myriamae]|nr:transporter substrate-binding domain-containing protein [gamma proteobacterium symbiont of Lucinoma myriamae]MCU7832698.1 transporter substrate-binding domain-containing protein [gamma proteobacterium symbiont of Lucinoma myriamae]
MIKITTLFLKKITCFLFVFVVLSALNACDDDSQTQQEQIQTDKQSTIQKVIPPEKSSIKQEKHTTKFQYTSKSKYGWNTIQRTGILRIIVPYSFQFNELLPRKSLSYDNTLKLIVRFAEDNNLEPVFISEKNFSNIFSLLNQGHGDVIAANQTILDSRKENVNFTLPVDYSIKQLVVAQSNQQINSIKDLNDLKIGVRENTSFWETINSIKEELQSNKEESMQDFDIIKLDGNLSSDDKFNQVVTGKVDAVIEDSNRLMLFKEYRDDIKPVLDLTKERPIAWAVRKNNPELLKQLNQYIKTEKLVRHLPETRQGDLDSIKKTSSVKTHHA